VSYVDIDAIIFAEKLEKDSALVIADDYAVKFLVLSADC